MVSELHHDNGAKRKAVALFFFDVVLKGVAVAGIAGGLLFTALKPKITGMIEDRVSTIEVLIGARVASLETYRQEHAQFSAAKIATVEEQIRFLQHELSYLREKMDR